MLLDAESAVSASRAALEEAESYVASRREDVQRTREAFKQGAISEKVARDSQEKLDVAEARLKTARVQYDTARRQAELAHETLATQVKLLELDLADAQLQLDQARKETERARQLFERKAMSTGEWEEKLLSSQRAELQVRRATTLLDLYRKALRDPADSGGGGPPAPDSPVRREAEKSE